MSVNDRRKEIKNNNHNRGNGKADGDNGKTIDIHNPKCLIQSCGEGGRNDTIGANIMDILRIVLIM